MVSSYLLMNRYIDELYSFSSPLILIFIFHQDFFLFLIEQIYRVELHAFVKKEAFKLCSNEKLLQIDLFIKRLTGSLDQEGV